MALVTKKKKVPAPTHTQKAPASTTSGKISTAAASKPAPTAIAKPAKRVPAVRKPAPASSNVDMRKPAPPKEVRKSEPPKKEQPTVEREERKSPEAPKPPIASERQSEPARPKPTTTGAEKVSTEAMREMSLEARLKLWKSLNRNPEVFVGIRKELPKKMEMRKDEALLRNIIPSAAPKLKNAPVHYCPYCVDYQVFHYHNWTGYNKCTGCGITSKDFYVGVDNGIFGKE